MRDNKLEVGDRLYDYGRYGGVFKYEVVRLTPKQAVLNNGTKVHQELRKRSYGDRDELRAQIIGEYNDLILENDETKTDFDNWIKSRKLKKVIERISWDKVPPEKLDEAIAALTPFINIAEKETT
jgi:hypothetical protein